MSPSQLILMLASIACFAVAAWQSSSPTWNRIACIGAALFVASFITW